jgi:hypothetical protein
MARKNKLWTAIVGMGIVLGGCKDGSAEWLRYCEDAESKGDVDNAWTHCSIAADKGSAAAKEKLEQLKPKYEKLKAEEDAKAAEKKAKADKEFEEQRKAKQAAQAARVAALREKVSPKWWGDEPDGECQAKGMPPYRKTYEGGLYSENEAVALADGCRHLFRQKSEPSPNDNIFCCPGR